jgi:hypothetical protein
LGGGVNADDVAVGASEHRQAVNRGSVHHGRIASGSGAFH